ncbi:MAG: hypothetical protein UU40_C0002G0051 [Candidatus Uhrbacteria bacterium GW2011_GWD2_41_121]|uniref:POTRA domain-containing protein n=1 Tax=Candidatus Uhrbacteria bacterium GW2011_GWC1_41_20 TaxID=1618983 RepID=A0A0G0VFX4_9BACT|nr:MAG: hypothetical protein UT52_C0002G0051 [Candidatus Uhrbacteria bacterium GW2011_GWE1_39_46]KKR64534.1 MAG: hypothetical protein UU04_C0001G0051 [Candidatus Uhrbacteria bacterium GW2011_GWC2_40_450]KKR90101.1 MAG: hypothetical protein UU36_C0011G0008 [Candidatus Uhrbacteria bacterium GW2011_GWE2_41_1153]KKR90606.1 MAG: hypothetical protein UU40_C0002G0051 [Candidatus Uhrbacteria bacterium GW2011_GWD2_41_121]KKR96517.1 MAG: hypothetical protein UU46_C0002G0053 [Candidatus Uhrbacteria bacter
MRRRNFLKSHQANVYKRSRFENPYFSGEKQTSWTRYLIIPGIFFILTLIAWGLIALPMMRIKSIETVGLVTIQPSAVEQTVKDLISKPVFYFFPGDHHWFLQTQKIANQLKEIYQLNEVDVQQVGRRLLITISERITRAIWVSNDRYFFLDENGTIVRELSPEERLEAEEQINTQTQPSNYLQSPIFAIWDTSNSQTQAETSTTTPNPSLENEGGRISTLLLSTIDNFDLLLRSSTIQPISYLIEKPNEIWVTAKTTLGVDIYINGAGDAQEQFDYLQLVLSDYRNQIQDLEYIDLRFGNRIYIR